MIIDLLRLPTAAEIAERIRLLKDRGIWKESDLEAANQRDQEVHKALRALSKAQALNHQVNKQDHSSR